MVRIGHWRWCMQDRSLRGPDCRVALTSLERKVLAYLVEHADRDVVASDLLRDVWGYSERAESRAVAKLMSRLRRKLGPAASQLQTVFGVGYRLALKTPRVDVRAEFRSDVERALDSRRAVILTGPPGIGKTHVAQALSPHGAWVSGDQRLPDVADLVVVDSAESRGRDRLNQAQAWLAGHPARRLLLTSTEVWPHEHAMDVPPLEPSDAARLLRSTLNRTSLPPLDELMERLGGLPQAVLAAADRLRVLGVDALIAALRQGLQILGTSSEDLYGRFAASWHRLDESAQAACTAIARRSPSVSAGDAMALMGLGPAQSVEALSRLRRTGWLHGQRPPLTLREPMRTFVLRHASDLRPTGGTRIRDNGAAHDGRTHGFVVLRPPTGGCAL